MQADRVQGKVRPRTENCAEPTEGSRTQHSNYGDNL
jgi:hypothetical protein